VLAIVCCCDFSLPKLRCDRLSTRIAFVLVDHAGKAFLLKKVCANYQAIVQPLEPE
tara:strand:+ start:276 stop:443 length:168 start_codon:yes stop_codon:yes gene_type:complete